ncbi:hypothetical protein P8605_14185 [Streptomyces sp. T-3]|nr:hypothetical protein [Streptomyces sp. T-3]
MALIVVMSAHSCGVTVSSLALALSGERPTLLAECEASKAGSVRTGYRSGEWGGEVGLWHLAQADRQNQLPEAFEAHLRRLDRDGNRLWLPGLTDPLQAAALAQTWEPLATLLQTMDQHAGYDVIVDAGRIVLQPGGVHPSLFAAPLLFRADLVLLTMRNTITSIAQSAPVVRAIRTALDQHGTGADTLRLLLIEEGKISSTEISGRLQVPVAGALPWDESAAHVLTHGAQRAPKLASFKLLKRGRSTVRDLAVEVQTRRLRLRPPAAPVDSPVVAGMVQRLSSLRQEVAISG